MLTIIIVLITTRRRGYATKDLQQLKLNVIATIFCEEQKITDDLNLLTGEFINFRGQAFLRIRYNFISRSKTPHVLDNRITEAMITTSFILSEREPSKR